MRGGLVKPGDTMDVLIVDDERPARLWLRELLSEYPEIRVIGEASSVTAASELLAAMQPDVVFLDVKMPPDTGFSLLSQLSAVTRLVFVTAYQEFAVKAFNARAIDYLLKPVHPDRLADTMLRLMSSHPVPDHERWHGDGSSVGLQELLPIRDGRLLRMVRVSQIAAIESAGSYTRILLSGQATLMVLHSLKDWERKLPSPPFVRLDRSHIVNMTKILQVQTIDRNGANVTLNGIRKPLSLGRVALQTLRKYLLRGACAGPREGA